ncbi:hypothetical protein AB0K00_47705 [Dactylosporangium sp. NPDC049525]|uniref:hypothetical protein n=1 Tax=Dactylosporangium sp. NPDC049525 TaxID=3154730 RepID=UPI0034266169
MRGPGDDSVPFRWDLVTPDQLGSMLDGVAPPDLWFLDDLVACAGKVLARGGNGDLVFVGRSLDSMHDLLGGALQGRAWPRRLPFSFARPSIPWGSRRWRRRPLTQAEQRQARRILAGVGAAPRDLARGDRPVTFVDVVSEGSTFTELYALLRAWIDEEREPWPVIRRKLRFVGVTPRRKTSPNAYRWQQDGAAWTADLPARAVVNVSLDHGAWSYFGDHQTKLTRSFRPERWLAGADGADRDERTRAALAEAVALVAYGRSREGRRALARATDGEPALAEPWLRSLVTALNAGS